MKSIQSDQDIRQIIKTFSDYLAKHKYIMSKSYETDFHSDGVGLTLIFKGPKDLSIRDTLLDFAKSISNKLPSDLKYNKHLTFKSTNIEVSLVETPVLDEFKVLIIKKNMTESRTMKSLATFIKESLAELTLKEAHKYISGKVPSYVKVSKIDNTSGLIGFVITIPSGKAIKTKDKLEIGIVDDAGLIGYITDEKTEMSDSFDIVDTNDIDEMIFSKIKKSDIKESFEVSVSPSLGRKVQDIIQDERIKCVASSTTSYVFKSKSKADDFVDILTDRGISKDEIDVDQIEDSEIDKLKNTKFIGQ